RGRARPMCAAAVVSLSSCLAPSCNVLLRNRGARCEPPTAALRCGLAGDAQSAAHTFPAPVLLDAASRDLLSPLSDVVEKRRVACCGLTQYVWCCFRCLCWIDS